MQEARFYSPSTGCTYLRSISDLMPSDSIELPDEIFQTVITNPEPGKIRSHDADGLPILIDPPAYILTTDELCTRIDTAADTARARVAGDPLRAVEYDRARIAAEHFAAAGYQGDVPPMVAAWAINGRTPREAADDILHEAAQYTAALIALRETRLAAKEQVRALMGASEVEQAQQVVEQTVAAIQAAVAGVGNNATI